MRVGLPNSWKYSLTDTDMDTDAVNEWCGPWLDRWESMVLVLVKWSKRKVKKKAMAHLFSGFRIENTTRRHSSDPHIHTLAKIGMSAEKHPTDQHTTAPWVREKMNTRPD